MNRIFRILITVVVVFVALSSCNKATKGVTSIYFTNVQNGKLTMSQGETFRVKYLVDPYELSEIAEITWTSSNKSVAAVNKRGTITAQSPGKAVITATSGNASAAVEVRVNEMPATSFALPTWVDVYVGKTVAVNVSDLEPQGTSVGTITWTVDKPEVASVSVDGGTLCVTATALGTANLVGLCQNGFKSTCKLNVTEYIKPQSVTLSSGTSELEFKGRTQISLKFTPSNASVVKPEWSITPSDLVFFDENTLTVKAGDVEGEVTIAATVDGVKSNELKISVIPPRPANCYIVSEPGDYSFKAVKGNSDASIGSVAKVEVLWEYIYGKTTNKGDVIESVSYSDGMIKYSVVNGLTTANALIAAKNSSGTILWSWHIWYVPGIIQEQTYPSGAVLMDRNLGALSSETPGLVYQWGRKDPMIVLKEYLSIDFPKYIETTETIGTIAYTVKNPTQFITSNWDSDKNKTTHGDWLYNKQDPDKNTRWGTQKTIYDPCPSGWKVPVNTFWDGISPNMVTYISGNKTACVNLSYSTLVFPLQSYIDYKGSIFDNTDYWTANDWTGENSYGDCSDSAYALWLGAITSGYHSSLKVIYNLPKAQASPVRCCRE